MNPFWNQLIFAGYRDGQSFLGYVDLHGTGFEDYTLATGYGNYLARPILRNRVGGRDDITEDEARKMLEDCMRVLFYRDARTIDKVQWAKATAKGIEISEPYLIKTDWSIGSQPNELML